MGFRTREKDRIAKIIVDIPEEEHRNFKSKLKARGYTIKEAIENFIIQYNEGDIDIKKNRKFYNKSLF